MYSLDVNFLKDRYLEDKSREPTPTKKVETPPPSLDQRLPMLIGAGVMLLLPALAAGWLLMLNWQMGKTQENIQVLDGELTRLNARTQNLKELEEEVNQIEEETKALATVFNRIKPWSTILQDIQNRTPPQVQIVSIKQEREKKPTQATPKRSDSDKTDSKQTSPDLPLAIKGYASNYDNVNDFLLALQGSSFFKAENTKLDSAKLVELPVKWQGKEEIEKETDIKISFPQVVEYVIPAELNQIPASELLPELEKKESVGLVTRIKTLKQKGVIQP